MVIVKLLIRVLLIVSRYSKARSVILRVEVEFRNRRFLFKSFLHYFVY